MHSSEAMQATNNGSPDREPEEGSKSLPA